MKMNAEKCHTNVLSRDLFQDNFTASIDNTRIFPEEVTLLGVTLDNNLNFSRRPKKESKPF